jgi:hypothetical protein
MPQKSIFLLKIVKHVFDNVLIIDLEHVRCLTAEESSAECAVMCCKGTKMCKQSSILTLSKRSKDGSIIWQMSIFFVTVTKIKKVFEK